MEKTIEQKAAETLLQKPTEVKVGEKIYRAAPPSVATLILVSEAVSRLPHTKLNKDDLVGSVLAIGKDCRELGDIAAILILGARHITETVPTPHTEEKHCLWGLIRWKRTVIRQETVDRKAELAKELLENLSPSKLALVISQMLTGLELGDFFYLTTFLTEANLLKPTKVET